VGAEGVAPLARPPRDPRDVAPAILLNFWIQNLTGGPAGEVRGEI